MPRPYVICHMMSPLDGRLIVNDWAEATGHSVDELVKIYDGLHEKIGADAWLSGRATGEEFADAVDRPYQATGTAARPIHIANPDAGEFAVIVDKDGRLRWDKSDIEGAHLVVLTGSDVDDAYLAGLTQAGVSYIVSEKDGVDLKNALDLLGTEFGVKHLMLEGGAQTNGHFLKAGLVDEVSLVIFPAIGGKSNTPAIFEGGEDGLAGRARLTFISAEAAGLGSVHLRYRVGRP
ncbi:RibD family protein [Rhizobium sophoriradicis]|uniref:5-amino-6-(5-phosphoribosylamino)uracil reductase n=1 Tax=Rhizobium sophoriradicis TaxID=1535245 RepID=A0A2A5KN27_9HYPH|nr:RibD family protein [Rhizobium sophoriradicis]PCK78438.1 5-amino-6-(5-phosphoribosylamino)uracil reductase [Rhizobium sophoriradicis]